MGYVVLVVIAVAVVAVVVLLALSRARSRRQDLAKLEEIGSDIARLHEEISRLSDYESGYLMKKDWDALLESAAPVLAAISKVPKRAIEASPYAEQVAYIIKCCKDSSFRVERNKGYKAHELELCDALFSDIDGGKSLDSQQRDAIVTDEYSNLVIAGAGSGKTSTVVGKVKYLVERWGVDPSEILVTSFTRASVKDLRNRIEASGVNDVSARTFHSIGLGVLGDEHAVAPDNALMNHVTSYLKKDLASNTEQASAFLQFFGLRNLTPEGSPDSGEAEVRMKLLKAQDMRTLKGFVQESRNTGKETLRGETVKSIEELMIANFLFLNGVEYKYETSYPYAIPGHLSEGGRRAYQPDFYLVDYDIWLEHFGIDEHQRVPWLKTEVEERRYLDGITWKREVHEACGTKLIESYSYWNRDQDFLNRLENLLTSNGVVLEIDPERNAAICAELLRDKRFFRSMSELISTFISLVKSGNKSAPEVDDTAREAYKGDGAMWHRYDLFTRFAWPILESYQKSLVGGPKPMVDFDDMINMAAERIRKEGFGNTYRYIIVDEYQDISLSRFGLLSAIRDATGAKLMCVGDDWQAIYRFAGSDVTLFTNFGKLVGYHEEMRIERTYRNSQALVDAASSFVLKNPDQMRKSVVSMAKKQDHPPIGVVSLQDQRAAFTFALNDLVTSSGGGGEIKVLGRNGFDLEKIFPDYEGTEEFSFRDPKQGNAEEEKFTKVIRYKPAGGKLVEVGFMTVHKCKGLQADNVIVIGLINDRYGFPNMIADDPILELLLADSDRFAFAEERRLFYVALTRTKNRVWLVTGDDSGYPGISMFVDELHGDCDEDTLAFYCQEKTGESAECPRCGGALLKREGEYGVFVGCSNYPFCDKTYSDVRVIEDKKRCPACGGWLTRRKRKEDGEEFYGCTNYPDYCYFTMDLDGTNGGSSWPSRRPTSGGYSYASVDASRKSAKPGGQKRQPSPRCPKCGGPMVVKTGKHGEFYSCKDYPSCKGSRNLESTGAPYSKTYSQGTRSHKSKGHKSAPACPVCGSPMVVRTGPYGEFYGCSRFPSCSGTRNLTS